MAMADANRYVIFITAGVLKCNVCWSSGCRNRNCWNRNIKWHYRTSINSCA